MTSELKAKLYVFAIEDPSFSNEEQDSLFPCKLGKFRCFFPAPADGSDAEYLKSADTLAALAKGFSAHLTRYASEHPQNRLALVIVTAPHMDEMFKAKELGKLAVQLSQQQRAEFVNEFIAAQNQAGLDPSLSVARSEITGSVQISAKDRLWTEPMNAANNNTEYGKKIPWFRPQHGRSGQPKEPTPH